MKARRSVYVLIILGVVCWFLTGKLITKSNTNKNADTNTYTDNTLYQDDLPIEQIKNELGYTADSNLYSIDTEYDGRKTLNIKDELQLMVAFDGLIKTEDLKISEVEEIFNRNYPMKSGIWIEENNREQINNYINTNTNSKYEINKEGYLEIKEKKDQNNKDIILEKLISSNKTIVLTINSYYYEIDNVTGEINKYPFEQLDEYQPLDMIKNENNILIVLSSNKNNKLTEKQILDELFIVLKELI